MPRVSLLDFRSIDPQSSRFSVQLGEIDSLINSLVTKVRVVGTLVRLHIMEVTDGSTLEFINGLSKDRERVYPNTLRSGGEPVAHFQLRAHFCQL